MRLFFRKCIEWLNFIAILPVLVSIPFKIIKVLCSCLLVCSCGKVVTVNDSRKQFTGIYSHINRKILDSKGFESIRSENFTVDVSTGAIKRFPAINWDVRSGNGVLRYISSYVKRGSDFSRRVIEYRSDGSIWNFSENRQFHSFGASGTVFRGSAQDYLEPPLSSLWASFQFCGFKADSIPGSILAFRSFTFKLERMKSDNSGRIENAKVTVYKLNKTVGTIELSANYKHGFLSDMELSQYDSSRNTKSIEKMTVLNKSQSEEFREPPIGSIFSDASSNDYYELGANRILIYKGTKGQGNSSASMLRLFLVLIIPLVFILLHISFRTFKRSKFTA